MPEYTFPSISPEKKAGNEVTLSALKAYLSKKINNSKKWLVAEDDPFYTKVSDNTITIDKYIDRFAKYFNFDLNKFSEKDHTEYFVYALVLLERYLDVSNVSLATNNAHRLLLVSLTTAVKMRCDLYQVDAYYAKVGGIPVKKLIEIEREFLKPFLELNKKISLEVEPDEFQKFISKINWLGVVRESVSELLPSIQEPKSASPKQKI